FEIHYTGLSLRYCHLQSNSILFFNSVNSSGPMPIFLNFSMSSSKI
uniref:Uncharacterized protein n=1 Tax=Dromaius novaehollandiae TaxID=8790 RepID=A0A8C4PBV8_DRONO